MDKLDMGDKVKTKYGNELQIVAIDYLMGKLYYRTAPGMIWHTAIELGTLCNLAYCYEDGVLSVTKEVLNAA